MLESSLTKRGYDGQGFVEILRRVNEGIGDPNYHIGISYFVNPKVNLKEHIDEIWCGEIEPYLDELLYGQNRDLQYKWEELKERISAVFS